jgi:hypothetical protein
MNLKSLPLQQLVQEEIFVGNALLNFLIKAGGNQTQNKKSYSGAVALINKPSMIINYENKTKTTF